MLKQIRQLFTYFKPSTKETTSPDFVSDGERDQKEVTNMADKVSLPPIRLAGTYYSLTYYKNVPKITVDRNGKFHFMIQGVTAREYIERLDKTNGYDTLVALLEYWRSKNNPVIK